MSFSLRSCKCTPRKDFAGGGRQSASLGVRRARCRRSSAPRELKYDRSRPPMADGPNSCTRGSHTARRRPCQKQQLHAIVDKPHVKACMMRAFFASHEHVAGGRGAWARVRLTWDHALDASPLRAWRVGERERKRRWSNKERAVTKVTATHAPHTEARQLVVT